MEDFLVVAIFVAGVVYCIAMLVGIFKIFTSDNIRLVKLILLVFSCVFPIFPIIYLFKNPIINEVKNAPDKIIDAAIDTGKITSKAINKTTDFLLKK